MRKYMSFCILIMISAFLLTGCGKEESRTLTAEIVAVNKAVLENRTDYKLKLDDSTSAKLDHWILTQDTENFTDIFAEKSQFDSRFLSNKEMSDASLNVHASTIPASLVTINTTDSKCTLTIAYTCKTFGKSVTYSDSRITNLTVPQSIYDGLKPYFKNN